MMTSSTHNNVVAHNFDDKKRTDDVFVTDNIDFDGLMLSSTVLSGLKSSGFVKPSPIQLKAIPLGRCGLDLIVQAKSGTGKTCVFSVISLESLQVQSSALQVLVLAPTREIAVQIWQVITNIGQNISGLACHTFIGGMPLTEDKQKLKKCQIAIGTPGRIKQLIESSFLSVENIRVFVLDEADKLLEESFQEQVNWIYSTLPENKQMIALSATYPEYLAQHLTAYMRNPTFLRLNIHDPALLGIRQFYATVPFSPLVHKVFECKTKKIVEILSTVSFQQCLIFSNLQTRAQNMSEELTNQGWPTACIAGSHDQKDRNEAMSQLKGYKCRVLISTDLTARGIDADKVDLVINLDVPKNHETYLHRIGRAGRFGTFGAAISIVSTGKELQDLRKVEEKCNTNIMELPVPIPKNLPKAECTLTLDDVVSSKQIITSPKSKEQSLKSITSDDKKSEINHGLSLDNVVKNCDLEVAPLNIEKGLQNCKTVPSRTSDNDDNHQAKTEIQLETNDILNNSKIMESSILGNNSTNEGNFNQNNVQALCNEVKEMSLKENGFENINMGAKMLSQNEDDEMLFVPAAPRQLVSISLPSLAEVIGYENIEEPHTYATAAKEERTWIKTEEVEKGVMNLKYSLNNKSQIIDNIQELLRIGYLKKPKNVSPAVQIEQVSKIFTETVSSSENPSLKLSAISRKFIVNGDTKDDVTRQDYQEYENDLRACQNENHTTEPVLEELSAITENETPSLKDQVAVKTRKIPNNKSYMLVGGTLERLRKDEANKIEAVESVEGVDKHSNFSFNRNLPGQRSEWDSHDETDTSEEAYSEEDSASITGEEGGETVKEGLSYSEYCRLNNLTDDNVKEHSSSTEESESDDIVDEEDFETDDPHGAYNSDSYGLYDDHYSSLHDEHEHRNGNESSKHWHEPYSNGASNGYSYHPWTYWPHMYSSPWGPAYPSGMFHNPYVFGCYPVHFNSHQYSYPQECPSKHDKVHRRKAWKQFQEIQAATKKYYDEQEKYMKSMLHK